MMRLRYTPILGILVLAGLLACSDTKNEVDGDAGTPDVDVPPTACNPITQLGCESGEKCAEVVASDEPFLHQTSCVPDGTVGAGGACTRGPAGAEGYDDCQGGLSCLNGACIAICSSGPPDTCRADSEAFGEGEYCTLFSDLFGDNVGLCIAGCNPADDGACEESFGCYLDATRGVASCAGTPAAASGLAQNADCYGPASGGCFLNGCAAGFTPLLNNKPTGADGSLCARYCTPAESYDGNAEQAHGQAGNCDAGALAQVGGTNGNASDHQCRFVQTFYDNTDQLPATLGMCVPVNPLGGGTWGDCTTFDWDGIKAAWNGAIDAGEDPNLAFNDHCLETPDDPMNSEILDICIGMFRGCLSLSEEDTGLQDPAGGTFQSRKLWAQALGLEIPSLNTEMLEAMQQR